MIVYYCSRNRITYFAYTIFFFKDYIYILSKIHKVEKIYFFILVKMMQLATTILFIVLLYSLFGTITAKSNDFNAIQTYDMITPSYDLLGNITGTVTNSSNTCCLGVKSVSTVLFTSNNLPQGQYINVNDSCNLFDSSKPVIIQSHGFLATPYAINFSDLSIGLVKKGYTVLSLDWSDAACHDDSPQGLSAELYLCAVNNVHEVGDLLANIIKSLINACKIPLSNFKLIGHSLGAHVCSFACKNLFNSGYGKPHLLIGIDPASPLYDGTCASGFCQSDAQRVVVYHTSLFGLQYSLGDEDLWFNNGVGQPACAPIIVNDVNVVCSHNIVIVYLIVTLNNTFIGVPTERRTSPIPNLLPGCSSNTTNCIAVDNRIFDSNYNATGDYCVFVTDVYPYFTTTNSTCQ